MSTRMIDFIYSSTIAYGMEFGEYYASFFFDGELLARDGAPIETPYLEEDLPELQFEQVGDTMWITHNQYKPRKLTRTTATTFSLDIIPFTKGPFLVRNDIEKDDGVTMAYTGTLTKDAVGILTCSADHFESGHVGAIYQLTHRRISGDAVVKTTGNSDSTYIDIKGKFTLNTHGTWTGEVQLLRNQDGKGDEVFRTFPASGDRNVQYTGIEHEYNVQYKIHPDNSMTNAFGADITVNSSTKIGIVRIDSITNTKVAACTVLATVGGASTTTTKRWAEGAWSGVQGYPKSITFFNDRCVYAGKRFGWIGRTSDYENFDTGVRPDDAFIITLSTGNEIMWVDTVDKTIVFGTTGAPWSLQSNKVGTTMTPANKTINEQSGFGSANIQGLKIENAIIFADTVGKKLMEYGYNAQLQKYVTNEITVLAEHFSNTSYITWLAHQKNPESIIWFGLADGTINSFTYQRDQNVLAYATHPTTGKVKSGMVIPSTSEDEIWLSVERDIGGETGVTCVERMWPRTLTDNEDAHYVDCGVIYDGPAATNITGYDHLEGDTVAIYADGEVVTPQVVSGGAITLTVAAKKVHGGLPFTPYLKPMRLDTEVRGSSSHGSIKNIPELVLSLLNSKNVTQGTKVSDLIPVIYTDPEVVNNTKVAGLFTGDVKVQHPGGYSVEDSILISTGSTSNITDPTPLTVRAIVARVTITGR